MQNTLTVRTYGLPVIEGVLTGTERVQVDKSAREPRSVTTAQIAAVQNPAPVREAADVEDMILLSDLGGVVTYTNAAGCEVTVPVGLPVGFSTTLIQRGAAPVSVVGDVGVTIVNVTSEFNTAGVGARVALLSDSDNEFILSGDTAA